MTMTKLLLSGLVASMLALTGLVAYNSSQGPTVTAPETQLTAAEEDTGCSGCCHKESSDAACPLAEKGACCTGDAAVKPTVIFPTVIAPNAEPKKE
jgi:hypothetical protein